MKEIFACSTTDNRNNARLIGGSFNCRNYYFSVSLFKNNDDYGKQDIEINY